MGHPAAGLDWLANKLHAVDAGLKKGQIVLASAFMRPVDVAAAHVIYADCEPLDVIGVSFI
jgi:2-oxo-hept-3-ene-1,7-dioate hydratase